MVTFQEEQVFHVATEAEPLLLQHFAEVAADQLELPLQIDWCRYAVLEESDRLAVYTARADGELIGYCVFFLYFHPHHECLRVASNDAIFLHPKHRKGATGIKLMRYAESQLALRGVVKLSWSITYERDFSPIMYRLGYKDEEKVVSKLLRS